MRTFTKAIVSIRGLAPLSQSHKHDVEFLEGESHDDYDKRTWRHKLNVREINGKKTVAIPAFGMKMALQDAAAYSKKRIKGQGQATWTKKFVSGIAILEDIPLNIDPETVQSVTLLMNADGKRGSGKRVTRRLPQMPAWEATFEVTILDPVITQDIFIDVIEQAGYFIGVGQYRPQVGGTNGRFIMTDLQWLDNRELVPLAA